MNLFRSEEHVERWLDGREPGVTMTLEQICDLAHAWWDDRFSPEWEPHTREQNQAILDALGLTGEFWKLG